MRISHKTYLKAFDIVNRYREQEKDTYVNLMDEVSPRVGNVVHSYFRNEFNMYIDPFHIKRNDILKIDMLKIGAYRNFGRKSRNELADYLNSLT